jgi:hypothetical protein
MNLRLRLVLIMMQFGVSNLTFWAFLFINRAVSSEDLDSSNFSMMPEMLSEMDLEPLLPHTKKFKFLRLFSSNCNPISKFKHVEIRTSLVFIHLGSSVAFLKHLSSSSSSSGSGSAFDLEESESSLELEELESSSDESSSPLLSLWEMTLYLAFI